MLFQQFAKMLQISVKMIFSEPGNKIFGKVIERKPDINYRNIASYSKKNQHFTEKILSDVGNLKYVWPRQFFIAHVWRGSLAEDFFYCIISHEFQLAGHATGNWFPKLLDDWEITSLPLFTFFWIDIF